MQYSVPVRDRGCDDDLIRIKLQPYSENCGLTALERIPLQFVVDFTKNLGVLNESSSLPKYIK